MNETAEMAFENGAEPTASAKAAEKVQRPGYWRDANQIILGNAREEFDRAMLEVQRTLDPVIKTDKEAHFKSEKAKFSSAYASLANVLSILRPVLNKHGFLLRQTAGEIRFYGAGGKGTPYMSVATHYTHVESGQWEMILMPVPIGGQITSVGAASTYAKRISLLSYHAIATEDSDGMIAIQTIKDQEAAEEAAEGIISSLRDSDDLRSLASWLDKNDEGLKLLSEHSVALVRQAYSEHKRELQKKEAEEANAAE